MPVKARKTNGQSVSNKMLRRCPGYRDMKQQLERELRWAGGPAKLLEQWHVKPSERKALYTALCNRRRDGITQALAAQLGWSLAWQVTSTLTSK